MGIKEKFSVKGKKAWVTGAAHGIGRASALALAEAGEDVALMDLNTEGLEETGDGEETLLFSPAILLQRRT